MKQRLKKICARGFTGVRLLRYAIWLCLQAGCLTSFSQFYGAKFEHIGAGTELAESNILCMLHDSRGFMWFGTGNGLYRYDGYKFTSYKHSKTKPGSITNNFIQAIAESRNGDLWVATSGGGLCRYDRRKDRFIGFKNDPGNINSIVSDDVNAVLEDSEGQVWIGTIAGLDRFDPGQNKFIHYRYNKNDSAGIADNYIKNILEDSHHNVWIATLKGGLQLFNRQSQAFTRFQHSKNNKRSISSNDISAIFEDSKKRLWIGTGEHGLDLLNRETNEFYHFRSNPVDNNSLVSNSVRSIKESNDHRLWVGTENGGISVFDPERNMFQTYVTEEFNNTSLGSNSVNTISKDKKGNMWIGTFDAGINMVNIDAARFNHYRHIPGKNSLSNNRVLCFYEDTQKNIWIGTDGGGLNLFDPSTGRFTHFRYEKNNKNSIGGGYVLSVCEDSKGNMWVGTWGDGITVFDRARRIFKHFKSNIDDPSSLSNNNVWKIFEDKDKNIWIGTFGGGLNKFNPSTNSFTSYQYDENKQGTLSDNWINSIAEDDEGNLWICTAGGGLNRFNKRDEVFTVFEAGAEANSIINKGVNTIYTDKNKNLWIATLEGLNFWDKKSNKSVVYKMEDGLPSDAIFGILEDKNGNIWISTDNGLSSFNPVTRTFKNFSMADGLQTNSFKEHAYLKSSSGIMYFGGNNGFNQFLPDDIKLIPFEAPLVITDFQVFNKDVPVALNANDPSPLKENITETKAIILSHKNSFFSFAFASLDYSVSGKKQYAYMLEGFDDTWNEVGTQRTATYTNLDPGKYVFKVKSMNYDGKWSAEITTIELTITPPFWLTWWFRITALLVIACAIVTFYFVKINAVRRHKKMLEEKVQEQTAQLKLLNAEEQKARQEADAANIELERKNKELEQFVYIASHDLREPLRTTSSFVDLLRMQYKGKLDEKADIYLSYITQAAERMKTLITDLLDYSRLGNSKELKEIDCNTILEEVLADLGIALNEATAKVSAGELPVITGHPTAIKQLFQNLIANSIKFRKKDIAPQICITAKETEECWRFSFADNGIGIDKQHNDKIFVIFQRLHTRKEYEGSGIGLAHCKKIVELHKGNIWVESSPGEGSTFLFTIKKTITDEV